MDGYKVSVLNSTKQLSAKERIAVKDFSNAKSIDEETQLGLLTIDVDYLVECDVHNEKAQENPNYKKYVVVAKDGTKYVTGSDSFIRALKDIMEEMEGEDEEYQIQAYRKPSKNYKGKEFLTCSIS